MAGKAVTLTSHFGGWNSIYLSRYFFIVVFSKHLKQGSQALRIDHETQAFQPIHTPHLVFLMLRRQRQPSCPANVVYINGRGAGTRSEVSCRQHVGYCFPLCLTVNRGVGVPPLTHVISL